MKKVILAFACWSLLPSTSTAASFIYTYTGTPYTSIVNQNPPEGMYTTDMRVTGFIALNAPLAPDGFVHIEHADPRLLAFSFSDGRFEYNKDNVDPSRAVFELATDATGGIKDWSLAVQRVTPAPGIEELRVSTHFAGCGAVNFSCDMGALFGEANPTIDQAESFIPGTWIVPIVPEPSTYALMLAGLGLVGYLARPWRFGG